MPFAATFNQNDPNKNNNNGAVNVSGQSTSFATNVPGQDGGGSQKKQGSGQYTNIQSYLEANKDQAGQMGEKIASNVANTAENAQTKIQGISSAVPTVQAYDPNKALGNVTGLSDAEKAQYKETKKTGGYTGPESIDKIQGYSEAQKAAMKAAQDVSNAGTEQGQQALLKETYARPDYSAGQNRLDQALLQGAQPSRTKLEDLSSKYAGISGLFDTASAQAGEKINQAKAQALQNQKAFAGAEQSAYDALMNPLKKRAEETQAQNLNLINNVQSDLADETLNEATLGTLGLKEGTRLYDLNLNNYLNTNASPIGVNNVANAEERAKYQALADLFENPTMGEITANANAVTPVGFDMERFNRDLAAREQAFNDLARSTNITGTGRDEQSYYTGFGGLNKNTVAKEANMNANLYDLLTSGKFNLDGSERTSQGVRFQGSQNTGNPIMDIASKGINEFGNAMLNSDWSGQNKGDDAASTAQYWADRKATEDFYNQLNRVLEQANYNRVIKKG